ncbi:hypothetical protein SGPA1_11046 [Streptomyces misionensis JCM 4497]
MARRHGILGHQSKNRAVRAVPPLAPRRDTRTDPGLGSRPSTPPATTGRPGKGNRRADGAGGGGRRP